MNLFKILAFKCLVLLLSKLIVCEEFPRQQWNVSNENGNIFNLDSTLFDDNEEKSDDDQITMENDNEQVFGHQTIHQNSNENNKQEKLYTYDEIVDELGRVTDEFYREFIQMRNMLPSAPKIYDYSGDDSMDPARKRRRRRSIQENQDSNESYFVPDFIRDGIQLISKIEPIEEKYGEGNKLHRQKLLCPENGFIIDFQVLKFNHKQYLICLVKQDGDSGNNSSALYQIYYGPIDQTITKTMNSHKLHSLNHPRRLLAFVNSRRNAPIDVPAEMLVLVVVNEKRTANQLNIKWLQINTRNEIIYDNHLPMLKLISSKNIAMWPNRNILIVHDIYEGVLKMFKFVGTYFDHIEFVLPISNDLNAVCAFTLSGISYLVLGFRSDPIVHAHHHRHHSATKDITILRYNDYMERLEVMQTIQTNDNDKVIGIQYFTIGNGINQENFLAIIDQHNIVMYKFLKSKREFLVFQRIQSQLDSSAIRRVLTYGDSSRLFVIAVILESNDVYFITYNSLRFIYSPINLRLYVNPMQPIYLLKISAPWISNSTSSTLFHSKSSVQLMIGSMYGIRMYNIEFFRDQNLFKLWTEHLRWCHSKRTEIADLEKHTTIIEKRFHESYFKSDPLIIHGTLSVPAFNGSIIEVKDYRSSWIDNNNNETQSLVINREYFQQIHIMKNILNDIEKQIHKGHEQLSNAVYINSAQVQTITGNYTFHDLPITRYEGNHHRQFVHNEHGQQFPATMNLITDYLNGKMIRDLFADVININHKTDNLQPESIGIMNQIHFQTIDLSYSNSHLQVNGLVNGLYNMSNMVTTDGQHDIIGHKRFHQSLIVDQDIYSRLVNGKQFDSENVLLTVGDQLIRSPVQMEQNKLRTGRLNVNQVNNWHFDDFISSTVRIDEPKQSRQLLMMPIEFVSKLIVHDLALDAGARLNGENFNEIYNEALWLNNNNNNEQTIYGDWSFQTSNMSIMTNLFVEKINNKMVPDDFIVPNNQRMSHRDSMTNNNIIITGRKNFYDQVYVENINVTKMLNGLLVINDIPDIVINDVQQNITGRKTIQNLSIKEGSSHVDGLLNGMSLKELDKRSQQRPSMLYFDRLYIDNEARFDGGLWFNEINAVTDKHFAAMVLQTLSLDDQWSSLAYEHVHFEHLHVNYLDCERINGINLLDDLFTRSTMQTITIPTNFNDIKLLNSSSIDLLNNYTLIMLNNIMTNGPEETINGTKEIIGDVHLHWLHVKDSINNVPVDDIVFNDPIQKSNNIITGYKRFTLSSNNHSVHDHQLYFDQIRIDDLIVGKINEIYVNDIFEHSLRRSQAQNISGQNYFHTLLLAKHEELHTPSINRLNLKWLDDDIVLAEMDGQYRNPIQNVTGMKTFVSPVRFMKTIDFSHLFDGVTVYEMKYNWLVNQPLTTRRVRANFSIDHLFVDRNVHVHDSRLNGIDLDWLVHNELIWLDKKTSIQSNLEFVGNVQIIGNILLNGRLNEIDLRRDVILNDQSAGVQKIHGQIRFMNNVTIRKDLDVNGLINNVDVYQLCTQTYRPPDVDKIKRDQTPLVIHGNVDFYAPTRFELINELSFDEIYSNAIRHDVNDQQVNGKKMIDVLILNGPTMLNRYFNDLNLDYIFEHYLSTTQDQDVEANIILKNVRFEDDVHVEQFNSDSGDMINGVDLGLISRTALRHFGDQVHPANIHFQNDVHIDLHLNVKAINNIGWDYFMNKKRSINTFTEEIVFTQDVHVKNSMNVVNGKRISNVHIDRILKDAVLQHASNRNYTIYGQKIFDKVDVYIIHTRPLNNITFSRENLLLKNFDQIVHGSTRLVGNLYVNHTLATNKINDINLQDLKRRLVKKTRPKNVIRTKVRVKDLIVRKVNVKSFIDNVNISILNQFSNTTNYLKNMDQELRTSRSQFEVLQRNIRHIGSKLLYYDRWATLWPDDLHLNSFAKPLMISSVDNWICVFLPENYYQISICKEVNVFCKEIYSNVSWNHFHRFHYPGTLLSMEQIDNIWLLGSSIQNIPNVQLEQCLQRNNFTYYGNSTVNSSLWFQSLRFLSERKIFVQNYHPVQGPMPPTLNGKEISKMILLLERRPSIGLIFTYGSSSLSALHIGNANQIQIYFMNETFQISGKIGLIRHSKNLLLVSSFNPYNQERLDVFDLNNNYSSGISFQLYKLSSIVSNINQQNIKYLAIVDHIQQANYKNLIVFTESQTPTLVNVLATKDGLQYKKIQEIQSSLVENVAIISNSYESDLLLIQDCDSVNIYRWSGAERFRLLHRIHTGKVDKIFMSKNPNYLYFFYGYCHDDENQWKNNHLEILIARYRQRIPLGNEIWIEETKSNRTI